MAASTGSGKTLAYILPAIEAMHGEELLGYMRKNMRPRCLVLVPTRDLARQVLSTVKQLSYRAKVSSCAVLGGEPYALQKKSLDRVVDLVVASPGRLMQHKEQGNVFFSHVNYIVIDEVDTMLTQGFGSDIRAILRMVLQKKRTVEMLAEPQLVMATATLTKSVKDLLGDVQGGFNIEYADPKNITPKKLTGEETRVKMQIVEVDGLHRSLPNVQHLFEKAAGQDKITLLKDILRREAAKAKRLLVFCNTVQSARAVEYAVNEDGSTNAVSYHGELNSKEREANLDKFRSGEEKIMVCTDLAARGLDIPETDHIVLFDFPLNPIDYLHRTGRCGRAGRKGKVTALVTKRDEVLANAIQQAIRNNQPIDKLSSDREDYKPRPKTATRTSFFEGIHRPRPRKAGLKNPGPKLPRPPRSKGKKVDESRTPGAARGGRAGGRETPASRTPRTRNAAPAGTSSGPAPGWRETPRAKRRAHLRDDSRGMPPPPKKRSSARSAGSRVKKEGSGPRARSSSRGSAMSDDAPEPRNVRRASSRSSTAGKTASRSASPRGTRRR